MQFGNIENILLLGGGEVLAGLAEELGSSGRKVAVITCPRHAEERLGTTTLQERLTQAGVPCVVTPQVDEDSRVLPLIGKHTLGLSFGAAWIFRKAFIHRFSGKLLNLHSARLPQERGGGSFSWLILRDLRPSCCLIHQVTEGVDDGPIVDYREFTFPAACRIPSDFQHYQVEKNLRFTRAFLQKVMENHDFHLRHQPEYLSTYWPRLNTEQQGYVNWSWSASEIERFILAFDEPFAGASTFWKERRVHLKQCQRTATDGAFHPFQTGIVYRKSSEGLFIAAGDAALLAQRVLCDGQDVTQSVPIGDRFYTPQAELEKALRARPVYTPEGLK